MSNPSTKTVFVANWHTNVIKERELDTEGIDDGIAFIRTLLPNEYSRIPMNGAGSGVISGFRTYDAALAWIKNMHMGRIERVKLDLARAHDKHKHPVKFYPLLQGVEA